MYTQMSASIHVYTLQANACINACVHFTGKHLHQCMCTLTNVCTNARVHLHTNACINACVHLQMPASMHVYTYKTPASMAGVHLHNYTYMNACVTYSYTQTPPWTCVYTYSYTQTPPWTCVYPHTHTYKHQHVQDHTKYNFRNIIINRTPFTSPRLTKDNIYDKNTNKTHEKCALILAWPRTTSRVITKFSQTKTSITNTRY